MKKEIIEKLRPYQKIFGYDQKYEWDKIAWKHFSKCDSVLDVGCGEGRFMSQNPNKVIGIDHNRKSLSICEKKGLSVKYAKVTNFPFEDNSFDAVHCSHVIEHLLPEDAHKLLTEMNRILKKGGIFCLRTPLMHNGFFNDLTHIKPYNPEAVLHYIKINKTKQRTLNDIETQYGLIKLKIRRTQIFPFEVGTPVVLSIIGNILSRFGIKSLSKNGYMLILRKR